ncbi:GGDEF domain-containing protein [Hydrogenimonas sp. SS33]|uniref:GGDEF domain-containing protein n=1 Tax=Hydrogenimonas leucolamina TaxID=2954236 RepID=UPI00336BC392
MALFIPFLPAESHLLIYTFILSLTYGSTMSIGPMTSLFLIFTLPMNLLLMIEFLRFNDTIHTLAALFLPAALIFSARVGRIHLRNFRKILQAEAQAKDQKREFEYRATHDFLTGLANRDLFFRNVQRLIKHPSASKLPFAIFFIDIDDFKSINDTYGHTVGDEVLKIVAKRLSSAVRGEDLVARFSGDEFVVLADRIANRQDADKIVHKLEKTIGEPIHTPRYTLQTGISVGYALFPEDGSILDDLVRHADHAMYQVKKERKHGSP